jgi:gliding motility-associated-like protein
MTFGQIGSDGILGSVAATDDTQLNIHIPCTDSLPIYGIPLGMNYMRIVATEPTDVENSLGSLIRVTIGAYRNEPQIITSYEYPLGIPSDVFCVGETVQLLFQPYNYFDNSTYMWQCNGINGGQPFVSPSGANSNSLYVIVGAPGTLTFSVQETNYGCVGPWSPVHTITVLGSPNANITGPTSICNNDTALFQVPFYPNTYYGWSNNADLGEIAYQDTANNILNISFSETGTYTLNINVLNACGSDSDTHTVTVLQAPLADAGPDALICIGGEANLSVETDIGYDFSWSDGNSNIGDEADITVSPTESTYYVVTVTGPGQCQATDTVFVEVQVPEVAETIPGEMCPGGMNELTLEAPMDGDYEWFDGSIDDTILVSDTGLYALEITIAGLLCPLIINYDVNAIDPEPAIQLTDSICPGGGNDLLLESPDTGEYLWSTGETTQDITIHDIGEYSLEVFHAGEVCQDVYEWQIEPDFPEPPVQLIDSICPGGGNQINLQPPVLGDSYQWSTGSTAPVIGINNPGNYDLQVFTDGESCQRLYEWDILPMTPDPPVHYLDSVCPGGRYPIRLYADQEGEYEWSTGDVTPFISVNDTGIYVLTIYEPGERCPRTLEFTIIADTCISRPDLFLYVPNSITTNNDGINELFLPVFSNPDLVEHYELMIFDRWGEKVFETEDLNQPWIANYKEGEYYVRDEVYIYMIEYRQEFTVDNIRLKGHVVVLR